MTKEEIEQAAEQANGYALYCKGSEKYNAFNEGFEAGARLKVLQLQQLQSENERLIKEIEDRVVECILDDIDFGYDLATIKGKIKSGSYVGNSPETFKENERLNQENKEIIRKLIAAETRIVQLKKENERLKAEREWTIDFDGKLMAGIKIVDGELSIVGAMDGYGNGISISKIVIKPQSPKQSCPQCKTEFSKEELLTNEHCFKCGFEMKGF